MCAPCVLTLAVSLFQLIANVKFDFRIGELIESLKVLKGQEPEPEESRDSDLITKVKPGSVQVPDRVGLLGDTREGAWHELQDSGDEGGDRVSAPGGHAAYKLDCVSVATPDNKEVLIKGEGH